MASKRISRKQLNEVIRQLPIPLREHSRRVKLLASFLTEKLRLEDGFLAGRYDAKKICDAVYYHDIGKAAIPRDNYYLKYCKTAAKRESYYSHVEEGLKIAQRGAEEFLVEYGPRDFETYLYEAIGQHHERLDGSGFPFGKKGEEIGLTGRICAIADALDNELFVGNSHRVNFEQAVEAFRAGAEGLDTELVAKLFEDMDALRAFVDFIDEKQASRRKRDKYGVLVWYKPIVDIRENKLNSFATELYINDPYYGTVRQEVFLSASIRTGSIVQVEKIAFRKVCYLVKRLKRRKVTLPAISFVFSVQQFSRKNFFKEIGKILDFYEVPASQFCFGVREDETAGTDLDLSEAFATFREMGATVAMHGFGESSSLMTTLESFSLNKVFLPANYAAKVVESPNTYSVVSGIVKIANNLHIDAVMEGVSNREIEANALRMGVKYAVGELYGENLAEGALYQYLVAQGGAL